MTPSSNFKQCSALKSNGERCQRVAKEGDYCHSHRHHAPKKHQQPKPWQRLAENYLTCRDCGHLIHPGKAIVLPHQPSAGIDVTKGYQGLAEYADRVNNLNDTDVLCEPCNRLRSNIESRIHEVCAVPGGANPDNIFADLEKFGIDKELSEVTLRRMLRENKVRNHHD